MNIKIDESICVYLILEIIIVIVYECF